MLCWGSWANTQKLATKEWRFYLLYWDFAIGVFLWALLLAFTLGIPRRWGPKLSNRSPPGGLPVARQRLSGQVHGQLVEHPSRNGR